MAKIIIFVGEHPAEATAMPIGRTVAAKLKSQGHEVRYERIHGPLPKSGTLVAYRGGVNPFIKESLISGMNEDLHKLKKLQEKTLIVLFFLFTIIPCLIIGPKQPKKEMKA